MGNKSCGKTGKGILGGCKSKVMISQVKNGHKKSKKTTTKKKSQTHLSRKQRKENK